MKHTALHLAVFGVLAGAALAAQAADVQIYGRVDAGFLYEHKKGEDTFQGIGLHRGWQPDGSWRLTVGRTSTEDSNVTPFMLHTAKGFRALRAWVHRMNDIERLDQRLLLTESDKGHNAKPY